MSADTTTATSPDTTYLEWQRWRLERDTSLAVPGGWLSLTGFAWLATEPESVDGLPGQWWTDGQQAYAGAVQADGVVLEDEVVDGIVSASVAEGGSLRWLTVEGGLGAGTEVELVRRGGRIAVRLRRSDAPTLRQFTGVPTYDYNGAWVVRAQVRPYVDGQQVVEVSTARDDLRQQIRLDGEITLVLGGQEVSVRASDNGDGTWRFGFHDQSNGAGTARWRTVATTPVDADGGVEIDFNRAINLPFAFGEFGTCPAPPPGNVLRVAVTAGEKAPA